MFAFICMAVLLVGCSEKDVQLEQKAVSKEVETEIEKETEVEEAETNVATEVETELEPEVVSQETIDSFLEGFSRSKKIEENVYQTLEHGQGEVEKFDLYTTWEFAPGDEEPTKLFEKKYNTGVGVSMPMWAKEVKKKFTQDEGYYVVEPSQTLTAESVQAMKQGYFPFSELRVGMTSEEAKKIAPEPYKTDENDRVFYSYSLDMTYVVSKESNLVTHLIAPGEVFENLRTIDEFKTLFGPPTNSAYDADFSYTTYEYVFGDYTMYVQEKEKDFWYEIQLTTTD